MFAEDLDTSQRNMQALTRMFDSYTSKTQPSFTCLKRKMETSEQCMKSAQSCQRNRTGALIINCY